MLGEGYSKQKLGGFNTSHCYLLLLFCSFFSISSLPINPVYCIGLITLFFSFLFFKLKVEKFQFGFYCYFLIAGVLFSIGSHYFSFIDPKVNYLSTILYLYCILLGAQTVAIGKKVDFSHRIKVYRITYNVLILFMFFELFLRIFNSGNSGSFYDYKWSLLYFDSNFVAFVILFFLMFAVFLKEKNILNIGSLKFLILIFLLIMTFSRASIVSFVVAYLFTKSSSRFKTPIFIIFLIIYFYITFLLIGKYSGGGNYVDVDGSFNSKFYLISTAIDDYSLVPFINKIFGIGLNNFSYYTDGFFAHNMFITLVYEFGVLGTVTFVGFLWYSYLKIGKNITYILVPLLIAGFSLFSAYVPFLFVLIGCMYVESEYIKNRISKINI
ncbi:hypothetical protein KWD71_08120 [Acinetobacter baumannii]